MISQYPSFDHSFVSKQGNVSLSLALFRMATPEIALGMMRSGSIENLNELTADGVSLLAVKMKPYGVGAAWGSTPIPSWSSWTSSPQTAWQDCIKNTSLKELPINEQTLAASMIFAGANPWVEWPHDLFDRTNSCFFSLSCHQLNSHMVGFLLDHPNCPPASYLDQLYLHQIDLRGDNYQTVKLDCPLLHYVANAGHRATLKHLISKGMDVNQQDKFGCTPVFYVKDKDVLSDLVAAGAVLDHKNKSGKTPSQYWKGWLSTSGKYADFSKILIAELKAKVSPDELRELQKPALLQELLRGTKGSFEAIYRAGKFSKDVLFDKQDKGQWSVATAALIRQDDKTDIFLRWCQEKKIGLDHEIWPNEPYTDGLLGLVLLSRSGLTAPLGVVEYLAHEYQRCNFADSVSPAQHLVNDLVGLTYKMSQCSMKPVNSLNTLGRLIDLQKDPTNEKKSLTKVFSSIFEGQSTTFSVDQSPLFRQSLEENLVSHIQRVLQKDKPTSSYYSASSAISNDYIKIFHSYVMDKIHNNDPHWTRTLALIFIASMVADPREKIYGGEAGSMQALRKNIHDHLAANALEGFSDADQELWEKVKDYFSVFANPMVPSFDTLMQRLSLQDALKDTAPSLPSASKRRM